MVFISLLFLQACASSGPKYQEDFSLEQVKDVSDKKISRSFYLLGDAGHKTGDGSSSGLEALKVILDSVKPSTDFILFLGDNVNSNDLISNDLQKQEGAREILSRQFNTVKNRGDNIVFIPGELDWDNWGMKGIEEQENYLEETLEAGDIFMPKTGCPLQFVDISDDVHLIVFDSQWFLNHWNDHPTINDDCPEIKTREALFTEIETELKKNQNKTTVFAMHHPLYSNGVHGGKFYLTPFLNPSEKKYPIPVLGSLAMLFRTSGGTSAQDHQNKRYRELKNRLETISKKWGNVVFASGHDHSLQYIEKDHVKQIISGSGAISSFAGLGKFGLFSYPGPGFSVFDVFDDGSSRVSYYSSENQKPILLYQKEVFGPPEVYRTDTLSTSFPATFTAAVYEERKEEIRGFNQKFWGEGYRDLYTIDVEAQTADLDTLYGGLEPMRMGGGQQTNSLRVKDSLDREYNFRTIKKDPLQYLQAGLYKNKPVSGLFEETLIEKMIRGFYTAAHPYAFLAVPTLAEAAEISHTNPELFYMPKQPRLGKYNFEHGDVLYMIEERPEDQWLGYEPFGSPNHDIQSTEGMFDRLRRDEDYSVNETAYIRARIFDMLIGDWDRHNDQWRWAEIEMENGDKYFEPIPRDRDQVFSNFDGILFNILRATVGETKKFAVYGEDIENVEDFNSSALALDRSLLRNTGREAWIEQAREIQENVTDEVIKNAFSNLPEEIQGENTEQLIKMLKGRRSNIVEIAGRYYDHLAKLAIMTATDKDDYIDVTRMKDGDTRVRITRNIDGDREEVIADKVFSEGVTEEIVIYGLDDDDKFRIKGSAESDIVVRLVGGQENDLYTIENGRFVHIYDHKFQENNIAEKNGAKVLFTDDYEVNLYEQGRQEPSGISFSPSPLTYNPDDGVIIGLQGTFTFGNLVEYPYKSKHSIAPRYFTETNGFDVQYQGEIRNFKSKYNYALGAYYSSPGHTRNFFGFGNETANIEENSWNYYRTRLREWQGEAGFVRESPYGHYFRYVAKFEAVKVMETGNRFLTDEFSAEQDLFKSKYFAGLEGSYKYESYDIRLNPKSGLRVDITVGGKFNVEDSDRGYLYLHPYLEFFNAISRNRKWVLNTRIQGQVNFGSGYEYYQAATVGGNKGLRGYRQDRFAGQQAMAAGADLRYSFDTFKTSFLPFQVGILGGYDIGRVWYPGQESEVWHDNYGGGFWIVIAEALNSNFNFYKGDEGWRFTFGIGKRF